MEWLYIKIFTWVYALDQYAITLSLTVLHTVHPQKSEKHTVQLKPVKITILYLSSQHFYTNKTQSLPGGIDEFQ